MRIKRDNVLLAVAAFVIAVMLRLSLQPLFQPGRERELQVPLELLALPSNLAAVRPPATVKLLASGTADDLDNLDAKAIMASIDLSQARVGTAAYAVTVAAPTTGRVSVQARPATIRLTIERVRTVERRIEVEPSGLPPTEYVFDGASVQPETVTVSGAESLLPRAVRARVILDLGQVRPSGTFVVPVEVLDSENRPVPGLRAEPSSVTVSPAVAAAPARRRLLVVPTWKGQPEFGYRVVRYDIRPSQLSVRGDSGALARVTSLETDPIDLTGLKANAERTVRVLLPDGLRVEGQPTVTVVITVGADPQGSAPSP